MVHNTLVRLSAEPMQTRMLVTQGARDIGKAVLPGGLHVHPRAMPTVLEGLALFLQERLCVVVSVDETSSSSCGLGLLDALGCGERNVFYDVGIAARLGRGERRRMQRQLRLPDTDFRDLRQLEWEWAR
jgi:hypothetical protein